MKLLLWLAIGFLLFGMLCLLERDSGLEFYLNDGQASLFVALAVLAGSSLISVCSLSPSNDSELYRAFCKVTAELEEGPLTREELGVKIVSRHDSTGFESQGHIETTFSETQLVVLERLIYEGKIIERNGKLSLPS
ncbi:MAG: hypothetical protein ACSHYB_13610 [Roseibacillus sp.]